MIIVISVSFYIIVPNLSAIVGVRFFAKKYSKKYVANLTHVLKRLYLKNYLTALLAFMIFELSASRSICIRDLKSIKGVRCEYLNVHLNVNVYIQLNHEVVSDGYVIREETSFLTHVSERAPSF